MMGAGVRFSNDSFHSIPAIWLPKKLQKYLTRVLNTVFLCDTIKITVVSLNNWSSPMLKKMIWSIICLVFLSAIPSLPGRLKNEFLLYY